MSKQSAPKRDINPKAKHELFKQWTAPRLVRSPYEPYNEPGVDCSNDPGVCDPSQAAELDVNLIIKKAQQSGVLPGVDIKRVYGDFSDVKSYQESLNIVAQAQEQFMGLDAELRAKLDNDPEKFLAYVADPKNVEEMIKMGLAERAEAPTPQPAAPAPAVANPSAPDAKV